MEKINIKTVEKLKVFYDGLTDLEKQKDVIEKDVFEGSDGLLEIRLNLKEKIEGSLFTESQQNLLLIYKNMEDKLIVKPQYIQLFLRQLLKDNK
jgi:hypothetical protein